MCLSNLKRQVEWPAMLAPHADFAVSEVRDSIVGCVPHLRAFARSLCGNRDKADDLVQEAIARALAAERSYTPGTNFKAWIFTILRNLYFNDIRKHRGRMVSCDNLGEYEPSCPPTHHAALEFCEFRRAFWTLSDGQREVLMLVGPGGLSYEEAAGICGCAVGTIKSRVCRARQELKVAMDDPDAIGHRTDTPAIAGGDPVDLLAMRFSPNGAGVGGERR
jgi:RNA polymerase sigma-70 factor (ECF subfamily)